MTVLPEARGLSRAWRWGIGSALALTLAMVWRPLSRLIWQLVLALLLAALALPLCRKMERKISRPWAAATAVAVLASGILGMIGLLVPVVISQVSLVASQMPRLVTAVRELWDGIQRQEWMEKLGLDLEGPDTWIRQLADWIGISLPNLIAGLGAGVDTLSRAFLSPVLAFYFLRDRETFCYRLSLWIPFRHRKQVLGAIQEMRREAGGYMRGQLLVALAVAALTAIGLFFAGTPGWLVLGLLMGLCEFIPYVGPFIGGVPIALFSLPLGMRTTLWALGVTILVQQIEGSFLSPRLMGGATGLHPVYVLVLLSAGGMLGGLAGMMAALPVFVCVRGASRVLYESRKCL
ncbi:MAG: AI-2E family transporter [Clostridia bacterium]|nr:AI-2E family transporter [Clostridia bacterium]